MTPYEFIIGLGCFLIGVGCKSDEVQEISANVPETPEEPSTPATEP